MQSVERKFKHILPVLALLFFCAAVFAAEDPAAANKPIRPLDYPKDLRDFRLKALAADGLFAPDIAFSVRVCPKCGKPYVLGNFPRLKRHPFDRLENVHRVVEENCIKRPAPKTMISRLTGKEVPRACPYCNEPERGAPPDKALFCHINPESGEDMQIEYEIRDKKLASHTFWRVSQAGQAQQVAMPDESEESFKKAYGYYFSLRAVWNEIFAANMDGDKVVYREVSPGLYFVFRPEKITEAQFEEFANAQLKPDKEKGLFTRLESPLTVDEKSGFEGSYLDWARQPPSSDPAATYAFKLTQGHGACFVGISYPELRKAAVAALASRRAVLTLDAGNKPSEPGKGMVSRGPLRMELNLAPLAHGAVIGGLSLHQVCAFELGEGSFKLDGAEEIEAKLRRRFPDSTIEISEGRYLIIKDSCGQERKVDLVGLSGKLDPENVYLFNLFGNTLLAWDDEKGCFLPAPAERDVSPAGLPAFIERRIRPPGFFNLKQVPEALYEPREDADGKRYDLCYTSECTATVVYVDPAKPRFKGLTVNEARELYEAHAGVLPMYIEAGDTLTFPGLLPGLLECKVPLLCGLDLASLASDETRATGFADAVGLSDVTRRIHFYVFSTNLVALSPRRLSDDEYRLVKSRAADVVKDAGIEPGLELPLRFDLPRAKPKGIVKYRKR